MLEQIRDLPGHIVGLSARGLVSKGDYTEVVLPLIEDARREGRHVRLLYELGREFKGFTPPALLQDAQLGLRGAGVIERIALVTDARWLRTTSNVLGGLLPCPVQVFGANDRAAAIDWLNRPAEHKGLTHRVMAGGRVMVVVVVGPIASEDFEALGLTVDKLLESSSLEGLVVHAKNTPSWENLGSLLRHLSFIRAHHRRIRRVALVTDARLAAFVPALAEKLLSAEVHCFGEPDLDVAVQWASRVKSDNGAGAQRAGQPAFDRVEQAGIESFPASDPPSFTPEA